MQNGPIDRLYLLGAVARNGWELSPLNTPMCSRVATPPLPFLYGNSMALTRYKNKTHRKECIGKPAQKPVNCRSNQCNCQVSVSDFLIISAG